MQQHKRYTRLRAQWESGEVCGCLANRAGVVQRPITLIAQSAPSRYRLRSLKDQIRRSNLVVQTPISDRRV
jgi:hypothetical protein